MYEGKIEVGDRFYGLGYGDSFTVVAIKLPQHSQPMVSYSSDPALTPLIMPERDFRLEAKPDPPETYTHADMQRRIVKLSSAVLRANVEAGYGTRPYLYDQSICALIKTHFPEFS